MNQEHCNCAHAVELTYLHPVFYRHVLYDIRGWWFTRLGVISERTMRLLSLPTASWKLSSATNWWHLDGDICNCKTDSMYSENRATCWLANPLQISDWIRIWDWRRRVKWNSQCLNPWCTNWSPKWWPTSWQRWIHVKASWLVAVDGTWCCTKDYERELAC